MPLILGTNSIKDTGFNVANSLRFNGSSDYLNRTPSSTSNRRLFTLSFWFKKTSIGSDIGVFNVYENDNNYFRIRFRDDDRLQVDGNESGSSIMSLILTQQLRDVSAWYHLVVAYDSAQSTASNRVKVYLNGYQVTAFNTENYPSQNKDTFVNLQFTTQLGRTRPSNHYFNGYMAEVVLIDGTALDATSFGEFDEDSGIWKPIDVSGLTFGTNGFYLDFENSGSLGADVSGNSNNFTVNNLTSIDQTTDTCTNNFATWNPLDNYYGEGTTSEGNTRYTTGSTNQAPIPATIGVSNGKWYWEVKFVSDTGGYAMIGIASSQTTANNELGHNSTDYAYVSGTGQYRNNDGYTSYGNTYTTGDIIGIALDLDNNKLYFSKNGTWQNSGDPTSGSSGTGAISITASASTSLGNYFPALSDFGSNTVVFDGNFGSPPFTISSGNSDGNGYGNFEYSVPSGYYALNTKNLAEYG
jgi:hypothetical protein